ncbi:MAG: Holliday junction branch migration protein RuvA [Candidatus Marinimicrobia bacterium]|jgi:Holliday junction DNA helicase RuvA|nr:Holliday junction branch migration protein RuvA [Candidatus Neomarinimicrobiota bacterium]MBT7423121.1 Holliday junction branch migration protein RuvA [Candidatus Neomarinimicrobiota bacterium]MDG2366087.1 Holliday junction branch migration protein RuvA [Candidatus Neomarinimicrobiota bacterium]|tara:strand:- start:3246 stop:3851 length:606 start_codon:yes stop_codon:yes gene_type:complete
MSLISSISGVLFSKSPSEAILDVGGIRFLLHISFATYEILPDKGNSVDILTHLHVKEDILDLYGFKDEDERALFFNLNLISGIGPRSAMNILSGTNPMEFKSRIIDGDVKSLTVIPGIGTKTAKRIIVELKEKFENDINEKDDLGFTENSDTRLVKDAANALQSLGYKSNQVNKILKDLESSGELIGGLEEIIRKALAKII